jgi:hypothetical protein
MRRILLAGHNYKAVTNKSYIWRQVKPYITMALTVKARTWISYAIIIFFLFLLFPGSFYTLPKPGVDYSWIIALHLAHKYNLIFGKDFVFTYGPFGILRNRYPIHVNKFVYILCDLYFFVVLFSGLRTFLRKNFSLGPVIFICLCMVASQYMEMEQWFFFFFLFFLFLFIKEPHKYLYIIQAALLSVFCFYCKVNSGVVVVFIFLVTLHYTLFTKKLSPRSYAIILLSYIVCLFISARLLNTELTGYVLGSLHFIKDYGDAMYLPLTGRFGAIAYWGSFIAWSLLIICLFIFLKGLIAKKQFKAQLDTIFIYGATVLGIFIWFKSGFVRADGHVYHFFYMLGPLALLLYIYSPASLGKKALRVCCWALLAVSMVIVNILPDNFQIYFHLNQFAFGMGKIREIKNYWKGFSTYDKALAASDSLTALPNKLKEIIGSRSTDIIPTEISTIYFNGLRYDPRPVLQSYAAYNQYLDGLGYAKYLSATAPEYVLFSYENSEERFAWTDEARVKLALMDRYSLIGDINGELLLKRRPDSRQLIQSKSTEEVVHVKLGEDIPVKKINGFQFSQFFIDYNWKGKINSFLYQPPALKWVFTLENGDARAFRAIRPVLADGGIINKFIDNTREFQLLLLSDGTMNMDVKSVRIEPADSGNGLIHDIKMVNTYYQFGAKPASQRIADSLGIVHLLDGNTMRQPLLQNPSDTNSDDIKWGITSFNEHNNLVRMAGWAFREKDNNNNNVVKVLARSDEGVYEVPSSGWIMNVLPGDLQGRSDAAAAGFTSIISTSQLPPGNYELGIGIYKKSNGIGTAKYIAKYIDVKSQYHLEKIALRASVNPGTGKVTCNIEKIEETKDNILVEGWAVLEDADEKTVTHLILQSPGATYKINTDLKRRSDILTTFKKPWFFYSGFTVSIPKAGLPKGVYDIGIEKAYPGRKESYWSFSERKLSIGISDLIVPERINSLPAVLDFYCSVDVLKDDSNAITISGWAINNMKTVKSDSIKVVLKAGSGAYISAIDHLSRPDVTASFNNGLNLDNCGFSAKISKVVLPKGKYQVGILIFQQGKSGNVKFVNQYITKE